MRPSSLLDRTMLARRVAEVAAAEWDVVISGSRAHRSNDALGCFLSMMRGSTMLPLSGKSKCGIPIVHCQCTSVARVSTVLVGSPVHALYHTKRGGVAATSMKIAPARWCQEWQMKV